MYKSEYNKKHYRTHKDQYISRNKERRLKLLAFVDRIKAEGRCKDCGISDPANPQMFDFHHVNNESKDTEIAIMVREGFGKDRILLEIKKCVQLCANCHRKRHPRTTP